MTTEVPLPRLDPTEDGPASRVSESLASPGLGETAATDAAAGAEPAKDDGAPSLEKRGVERFRLAKELSPIAVEFFAPVFGGEGRIIDFVITYQNRAAARVNGLEDAEVLGRRLLQLFPQLRDSNLLEEYARCFVERRSERLELAFPGAHGEQWFECALARVGEELAVWFTNVSERKHAEARLDVLSRATAAMASSRDLHQAFEALGQEVVPRLADWFAIDLVETAGSVRRAVVAHPDPERRAMALDWWRLFPPESEAHWLFQFVREKQPTGIVEHPLVPLPPERDTRVGRALRELQVRQSITVPVVAGECAYGALTVVMSDSGRAFRPRDVEIFSELGRRVGMALENARLVEAERRAAERLALLARAGETFAEAVDYEATLANVVHVALPTLGDFGFFDVRDGDTVRRFPAAFEDADTLALLARTQWVRSERQDINLCALSSGFAGLHPAIDAEWRKNVATSPGHLALLEALGLCSMVTVPVHTGGELIGALTLCHGRSRRQHTGSDLTLAEELARRAGLAMNQARLLRQAREAAARAEEAARLKDEFLATVSHELRTPLNAILGWSTLLQNATAVNDPSRGLEVIHRNAVAQAKLVDDLLDVSRIITGKLVLETGPVDLVDVTKHALEAVRPSLEARALRLEVEFEAPRVHVPGDPGRLQQVAWNLFSNAVKFSTPGGLIHVAVRMEGCDAVLEVRDQGRGIDPRFLPYVFERFRQADSSTTRAHGGLGLGLAIVRHIVELHGGRVAATSPGVEQGTTFTVRLPAFAGQLTTDRRGLEPRDSPGLPVPSGEARATQLPLAGVAVLVVDDEADAREIVRVALENAGCTVVAAASVHDALTKLDESDPDALVSDIGMPGADGYDLIRCVRARRLRKAVVAVALSAYARSQDREHALAAGYDCHLPKPVRSEDLLGALAGLLQRPRARH